MNRELFSKRAALNNGSGMRYQLSVQSDMKGISAFVVKFQDSLYAYENRCPHLGVELDWAPGEFFDNEQMFLVCSTHGAHFKPDTGKCVSGPCVGQSLKRLDLLDLVDF